MNNRIWLFCECYDLQIIDNKKKLFILVVYFNLCKLYFIFKLDLLFLKICQYSVLFKSDFIILIIIGLF